MLKSRFVGQNCENHKIIYVATKELKEKFQQRQYFKHFTQFYPVSTSFYQVLTSITHFLTYFVPTFEYIITCSYIKNPALS